MNTLLEERRTINIIKVRKHSTIERKSFFLSFANARRSGICGKWVKNIIGYIREIGTYSNEIYEIEIQTNR